MERQAAGDPPRASVLRLMIDEFGLTATEWIVNWTAAQPETMQDSRMRTGMEQWQRELRRLTCGRRACEGDVARLLE